MTFLRYIFIQVIAYGIDLGAFMLALKLDWLSPIAANLFSKLSAGFFAFIAHRHVTFRIGHQTTRSSEILRYFLLLGFNLLFCSALLALLLRWLPEPTAAKIATDVCSVVLTFWLSKRFIFVRSETSEYGVSDRDGAPK